MVPAHIVFLDRLPKTSSGKIDRKVLAQHTVEQPVGTGRTIVAPRNDTEKKIAEIWAEELGLNTVSVVENFFDLGGHSLILAKISVRLQETVNKELSMVDMFTFPTVATLADHISNKTATATKMPDMAARAKLQKSMYGKKGSTGK
jgi:acyl carrier protein